MLLPLITPLNLQMEEMCSEFDMKHYLTLIRKSDFTDLFKFGHLFIDIKGVVEFDGDTETLSQNTELRDKLFERANQFDYSFTVLIVHFKSAHLENGKMNIEEVQNIFALDNEAKREIEISYDPRINICDPIWPNAVKDLQDIFLYEDAKKGANNIWKILNIKQPISEMESFFPDENIKGIAKLVNQDKRPEGNLSFWTYLLRYERHGFFPKTTSGYFMDLINVFINTLQKKEFPSEAIEATAIYKEISRYQDLTLESILSKLNASETGKNFIEKINEIANSQHNAFIIAILFLILRDQYKDGFSVDKNNMLINLEKKFPHEINYSLYLLGVFLGNSHTFECLYDSLPLAIFKKNIMEHHHIGIPSQPISIEYDGLPKSSSTFLPEEVWRYYKESIRKSRNTKKQIHLDNELRFALNRITDCRDPYILVCVLNDCPTWGSGEEWKK